MARLTVPSAATALAWLAVAATPAFARTGRLGGGGSLDISLTRIIFALLLCLIVTAVVAVLLKRSGGRIDLTRLRTLFASLPVQRRIEPIETRRVSQHADLCLVRCDGREYLILASAQQQLVLRETEAAGKPAA